MAKQNKQELKRPIDIWFDKYAESHQNPTNKIYHFICVPIIFFSILGLIWLIPFPELAFLGSYQKFINWASLAIAFVMYYYYTLSNALFFMMIWVIALFSFGIVQIEINMASNAWIVFTSLFVAAWIGQFIGHKIEGKKPSFFDDLRFLLIGPLWILHFICKKAGLKY